MIRRVPASPDDSEDRFVKGHVYQRKLPGLSGRPSFRVTLPPIRQRLGDVTAAHVAAEGRISGNTRALKRWQIQWVREHDAWARRHPTASDEDILRRFRTRHADRYCWVLTIALQDPVLCMAEQRDILTGKTMRGLTSDLSDQYVRSGGIDPYAEAVDAASLARLAAGRLTRMEKRLERGRRLFGSEA